MALQALGIERQQTSICLGVTHAGQAYKDRLRSAHTFRQCVIGLNIGCGTEDALPRRPPLLPLVKALHALRRRLDYSLLMVGASFEKETNVEFAALYQQLFGDELHIVDTAGSTSISELTGAIDACDLFISSDSGPYHMAVGLHRPTLAWFVREEPQAHHLVPWCRCMLMPTEDQFCAAALELLSVSTSPRRNNAA